MKLNLLGGKQKSNVPDIFQLSSVFVRIGIVSIWFRLIWFVSFNHQTNIILSIYSTSTHSLAHPNSVTSNKLFRIYVEWKQSDTHTHTHSHRHTNKVSSIAIGRQRLHYILMQFSGFWYGVCFLGFVLIVLRNAHVVTLSTFSPVLKTLQFDLDWLPCTFCIAWHGMAWHSLCCVRTVW